MSKESTKSAKVAYLKSKEGRSNVINCFWAIIIAIIFLFRCLLRQIWKVLEKS